ncbi:MULTISPECIES: extradiol ring-cleavage dioxygenase [unclassified Paenibacillus]|uniref:DODA-type extradiol aromatic ring-opening family dioxygenase n=1 Tax=unclassified Paenibacillus TaxID=185978 RepID=UPI001AE88EDF|nr:MULTISPECIES: extradiol ring-cleavage dioxygenase [unclassified Paenibacillus]MBP1155597.1 3,4-dihydroxyphenylacetate 2,3-dioxygenase [Paenibacillus sp. PvP091]MBP1169017.1 3,4-dihydroxyphenylacetate 2,3-dioxygenase [Paenibacillus sp. PvR098]MBP2440045.1 3,4-dihydroxyphenylacetate 2,3-dioxygenase [Paenibacillus sp. PvP052]
MSLEMALLAAHVPSMCHEERVPDFQQDLVKGLHHMRDQFRELKTDVVVLMSCHFTGTFDHYVDVAPVHKGVLTAVECPDLIADVPYNYPGDEELGRRLVEAGKNAGLPVVGINDPTYMWDYGTVVPLRYLIPQADIAVVSLSICLASSLEETYAWGEQIGIILRDSDRRAVFVSSGALSHNLVRGRQNMPTRSEQAMDNQFMDYLLNGDYVAAREMLTQYSRIAGVESGGRHLAAMLGVLDENHKATFWGYGQSSGSSNAIISFVS